MYNLFYLKKSPQFNLILGFLGYLLIGFSLLSIPWFHKESVSFLDNFFIATSAISTTGLVTVSIFDSYNFFGQFLIMILIQLGGIGYMTLTTYYLIYTTKHISFWHNKILGAEFTLPKTIKIKDFIKSVVVFTFVMEIIGSIFLFIAFKQTEMDTLKSVWFSIFHSISAFCTAGFSLFNNSFVDYKNNHFINIILSILSIAGSLGFIVITDLWYRLRKKTKGVTFTTKVIFWGFLFLLSLGTILIYFLEPSIQNSNSQFIESFFQAMTAMTTVGFNSINIQQLSLPVMLLLIFLMYVGASPSGTAGGLKITTVVAMIAILKSRIVGQKKITFLKKFIPLERIYVATSIFIMYTSIIFFFTFLLSITESFGLKQILFEVASALGTVGLSIGIVENFSVIGKILTIILMFIGRVGVLTFGFALFERKHEDQLFSEDDIAV